MKRRNFLKGVLGGCIGVVGTGIGVKSGDSELAPRRTGAAGTGSVDTYQNDVRLVDVLAQPWCSTIF